MRRLGLVGLGVLLSMATAEEVRSQSCLSSSVIVATPTITPNRKPIRLAPATDLIGAIHLEFGTNALFFGLYNQQLVAVGPQVEILRPVAPVDSIAFIFNGTDYGFFFNQPSDPRLRFIRISPLGAVLSGPSLALNEAFTSSRQTYDVQWDGAQYVIARTDLTFAGRGVWLHQLSREGALLGGARLSSFASEETTVFLELIGKLPIVIWNATLSAGSPETNLAIVANPANSVNQLREIPIAGRIAATAVEVDRILLVSTGGSPSSPKVTYAILDRDGFPVVPETDLLVSMEETFAVQALLGGSGEIALAYRRIVASDTLLQEYRLRRMSSDFTLISDLPFSPDPGRQYYLPDGEPVRTQNSYVHSVSRGTQSGFDASMISRCPYLARLASGRFLGSVGEAITFSALVSGGNPPYSVRWDFGDRFFGSGNPVTHSYLNTGIFTVKATITDASGAVIELSGFAEVGQAVVVVPPTVRRRGVRP